MKTSSESIKYTWVYNPKLYDTQTLSLLIKLIQAGIDIRFVEKAKVSYYQAEALVYATNKGFDITCFSKLKHLPSVGMIRYIADMSLIKPRLVEYVSNTIDLPTLRWVATWIDSEYENELKQFLLHNLDWAQLEILSKMYVDYTKSTNPKSLDPRRLLNSNLDFKTLGHINNIFKNLHIDITKYFNTWEKSLIPQRVEAVDLGVPIEVFSIPSINTDIESFVILDILNLLDLYGEIQVKIFIARISKITDPTKISHIFKKVETLCKLHTKNALFFKTLNNRISYTYLGI